MRFRVPVFALALAIAAGLVSAPPAAGCVGTRLLGDEASAEAAADLVFTGTVVKRDEPFSFGLDFTSSADPIGWTFVVESVDKGPQLDRVRVESPRSGVSCGVEFTLGQRYRVLAHAQGLSLSVAGGDATKLQPLPDAVRPPTEPGGLTFPASVEVWGLLVLLAIFILCGVWVFLDRRGPGARASAP